MTYTIARYPVHLIDIVRVAANGSRVTIRPTLPPGPGVAAGVLSFPLRGGSLPPLHESAPRAAGSVGAKLQRVVN